VGKFERQLGEGEQVVLDLHPHWRRLILPMSAVPIIIGVAAFALGIGPGGPIFDWIIIAAAVVVLGWFSFLPWLRWRTTRYIVTNRRVLYRSGIEFEKLGFRFKQEESVPHLQQSVSHGIYKGFVGPIALYGLLGAVLFRNRGKSDEKES
jgi:hypothetical protein